MGTKAEIKMRKSTVRICNSCVVLCLYAFQLKVDEMHLWAITENWFVIGWSIFSSLVKVKIHLIHAKFIKSLIEMCRKYAWQYDNYVNHFAFTAMTYTMN